MQITVIGLLLGVALLLVPIYFFQAYGLRLLGRTLSACAMMVAKFAVVGAVLYFLFLWNNIVANILFAIVAVVLTAAAVVVKARLSLRHSFVPLLAGVAVAVVTVGAWMLFAVMTGNGAFTSPRLIPVVGLLCGAILEILGKALTYYYYMGLRNHNDMYYFMLGNGATRQQALFYFRKRAMERTVTHFLRLISSSMFGCVPFIMWGMLLSGTEVVTAVAMQIVALAAMFTTALVALAVVLAVASRYSMDEYGRLKEGADSNSSTNDDSVPYAPASASESAASASSVSSSPVSSASFQTSSASYSASGSSVSEENGREEDDVNPVV